MEIKAWSAPAGALADALQGVMVASDDSDWRNLDTVYLRCRGSELTLAATNGHRLTEAKLPVHGGEEDDEAGFLIPTNKIDAFSPEVAAGGRGWKPLTFSGNVPRANWEGGKRATFRYVVKYLRSGGGADPISLTFIEGVSSQNGWPRNHLTLRLECPQRGRTDLAGCHWSYPDYRRFFAPLREGMTGITALDVGTDDFACIAKSACEWRKEDRKNSRLEHVSLSLAGKRLRAGTARDVEPAREMFAPIKVSRRSRKTAGETRTFNARYLKDALLPLKHTPSVQLCFSPTREGCFLVGTSKGGTVDFRSIIMPIIE